MAPLCFCWRHHNWSLCHVLLIFDFWEFIFFFKNYALKIIIIFFFRSLSSSSTGAFVFVVPSAVVYGIVLKNWLFVSFFQFHGSCFGPDISFYIKFKVWGLKQCDSMKLTVASTHGRLQRFGQIWSLPVPWLSPSPSLYQLVFFGSFSELVTYTQSVAFQISDLV